MTVIVEYIWFDCNGNFRSKSRTLPNLYKIDNINQIPDWNYDGSSTGQAHGNKSEINLLPKKYINDPFRNFGNVSKYKSYLVLCNSCDNNGNISPGCNRPFAEKIFQKYENEKIWFGLEQEYVLYDKKTNKILGWPTDTNSQPKEQGDYYCGIGSNNIIGRQIAEKHYQTCLDIGLSVSGINAEVMLGQWEYQIGPVEGIDAADQLVFARFILERICENYDIYVSLEPKPVLGNWNGSGCHINISTENSRKDKGYDFILKYIKSLEKNHTKLIPLYGNNEKRLTGLHETSSIDNFTYGVADRSASIRIPTKTYKDQKGYFEDRRPASDIDPYLACGGITKTLFK